MSCPPWMTDAWVKDIICTSCATHEQEMALEIQRLRAVLREFSDKTLVTIDFTVERDAVQGRVFRLDAQVYKAMAKSGPSAHRRIAVSDKEAAASKVPVVDLARIDMARHVMATILDAIEPRQVTP